MKTLFIILTTVLFTSCEKEPIIPSNVDNDYPWELSIHIDTFKIHHNLVKATKILSCTKYDPSSNQNVEVGKYLEFSTSDNNVFTFVYMYGEGITQGSGYINSKSYVLIVESNTINICGGPQNIPINYF